MIHCLRIKWLLGVVTFFFFSFLQYLIKGVMEMRKNIKQIGDDKNE